MESLQNADITRVPAVITDLTAHREWTESLLKTGLDKAPDGSPDRLRFALALVPGDKNQVNHLKLQLPICLLNEFPVLRAALLPHKDKLVEWLWQLVQDEERAAPQRFQAAAALAEYAPDDERWPETAPFVSHHLTTVVSTVYVGQWLALFQPAGKRLTDSTIAIHADRNRSRKQRETAAFLLANYLQDQPDKLAHVILFADELAEFSPLIAALEPHAAQVKQRLVAAAHAPMPVDPTVQQRDAHWKLQSLAAVTLMHLGYGDDLWSLMRFTPDPSLRSFIIHHLGKLQADHNTLADRLEFESEVSIRRALVQSLGGLDSTHWYINSQGQTMVVISEPSPSGELPINHSFAISSHEVTVAEYRRFNERHRIDPIIAPSEDCPMPKTSWYMAAEYCNWLSEQNASSGPLSPVYNNQNRALRGGTFYHPARYVTSGEHDNYQPDYRNYIHGFRPARTMRSGSF